MQGAKWWLVCYDVRDPDRLRKAAKHLEGYGRRMQYSVFRCWMTPRQEQQLRWELTGVLTAEDDVLLIPLCGACVSGVQTLRLDEARPVWPGEPEGHAIV
jgi:CRISPR-associated protein Cas2